MQHMEQQIEEIVEKLIKEKYEKGYFQCMASYVRDLDCIKILLNGYKKDDLSKRYNTNCLISVSMYERLENKESYIKNVIEHTMCEYYNFK